MVTRAFVADVARLEAPDLTPQHLSIVRCIVLRNIASRRLSGQMARKGVRHEEAWLRDYVCRVIQCFIADYPSWRRMTARLDQDDLLATVSELIFEREATKPYSRVDAWREDVVATSFLRIADGIHAYPFDLPLRQWMMQMVEASIWQLRMGDRLDGSTDVIEDEIDHPGTSVQADLPYEGNPGLWDESIDLQRRFSSLSPSDRSLLTLKLNGAGLNEIARVLNLAQKTISNRLWRLQRYLVHGEEVAR